MDLSPFAGDNSLYLGKLGSGNNVRHAVKRHIRVASDELEALALRLGDEHAVEWVAVDIGQGLHGESVRNRHRQMSFERFDFAS